MPTYKVVRVYEVTDYLRDDWKLYGQPFAEGEYLWQAITKNYSYKNPVLIGE